jgi:hypothetical protein
MAADPNDLLLSSIRSAFSSAAGDPPLFALGGIIDSLLPSGSSMTKGSRTSPSYRSHPVVTIRWETSDSYYKISLPFLSANDENGFEKLVRHHSEHCIESFNVDFHPYDYGVVDTVAQVLAPGDSRVNVHLTALDVRECLFVKKTRINSYLRYTGHPMPDLFRMPTDYVRTRSLLLLSYAFPWSTMGACSPSAARGRKKILTGQQRVRSTKYNGQPSSAGAKRSKAKSPGDTASH